MIRDWREREFDKLIREEFGKRGFYLVGSGPDEWAPMINGFKSHAAVEKFIKLEAENYRYVAYKNLSAEVGNCNQNIITGCLFIKIGAKMTPEETPKTELMMFYRGRMYKYASLCHRFSFRICYVSSMEELKSITEEIWDNAWHAVETWQRSVRTLVIENRWPEEKYISDLNFLEDE